MEVVWDHHCGRSGASSSCNARRIHSTGSKQCDSHRKQGLKGKQHLQETKDTDLRVRGAAKPTTREIPGQ